MGVIQLKIEQLVLDTDNPRITRAEGQQQALQKVVKEQKLKLVRLAESIVGYGLNPIKRLMVMEVSAKPKRYIALEGNRRVATLKLLKNPAAMTGLDMPDGMQRRLEQLAKVFEPSKIEPIDCYEVPSRDAAKYWIELEHNGEAEGAGVVGWKPIVAARFRKKEPAIQAFEMVLEHGGFNEDEAEALRNGFSLTTLRRLMDSKEVRESIGLSLKDGQLVTQLPGSEIIKPMKRIIRDIADKRVSSRGFNKKEQMLEYVQSFGKADRPDLGKKVIARPVEGIEKSEFGKARAKSAAVRRTYAPAERKSVVPKTCALNITNNRIAEIYQELRTLKLNEARNAIAVLLRVFLELSVDHYCHVHGIPQKIKASKGGHENWKKLDKKLSEVVDTLVSSGVPKTHFSALNRTLNVKTSPMNIELFHLYVHDRFATPSPSELTAAWDHAQPLFEKIWP